MELETLSDSELEQVYKQAGELLTGRRKQQQLAVIEEARTKLAEVGLTLRDLARLPRSTSKSSRSAATTAAAKTTLTNPANPSQTWTPGRGRPPQWAKKLQAAGESLSEATGNDRKRP